MKVICSEGEKLPDVVADSWNIEGAVSINCYGPAECAVTIISESRLLTPVILADPLFSEKLEDRRREEGRKRWTSFGIW